MCRLSPIAPVTLAYALFGSTWLIEGTDNKLRLACLRRRLQLRCGAIAMETGGIYN